MWEAILTRVEIVVGLLVIAGGIKTVYNGRVRDRILRPLDKIEPMYERVEQVEENQEELVENQEMLTDATIALGESHRKGQDFDVDEFRKETGRDDPASEYLSDDD